MRSFHLHHADSDITILAGSTAVSSGSLCPPFESCPNQNLFQQYFGIEFIQDGHTHVRAISTYDFARCFGLVDSIQYRISHKRHKFGLDASMPSRTSAWLFEKIHSHLVCLRDANSKVFLPNQFVAYAATIQALVSGTICTRLPSKECWAAMVVDNVGRRPLHSATTVAAVSSAAPTPRVPAALRRCLGRHRNHRHVAVLC